MLAIFVRRAPASWPGPTRTGFWPTSIRVARRFYWHALSKQRSCSPYRGIFHQYGSVQPHDACWYDSVFLGKSQAATLRTLDIHPLYKGAEAYPSFPPLLRLFAPRVPTPETQAQAPRILNHVRIQPSRPVGGLIGHRGGHCEA